MDPLHTTIEEFVADGYTHVECFCPRCRVIRLRPMSWLPKISMGLTIAQLSERRGALNAVDRYSRSSRGGKRTFSESRKGEEISLLPVRTLALVRFLRFHR